MLTRAEKAASSERFKSHFKLCRNAAEVLIRGSTVMVTLASSQVIPENERIQLWEGMPVVWSVREKGHTRDRADARSAA